MIPLFSNFHLKSAFFLSFLYFFLELPDLLSGLCLGLCLVLFPLGLYTRKYGSNPLHTIKENLLTRIK